ncbi:MAG TPA: co-chaperone GroES family protein [Bacteroidales bacterium]|nr:co-chaperone GroES family protein [Bacteroidales bacterium]
MLRPEPIGYNVAVIDEKAETTTKSGLYIPLGSQEKPVIAVVFAVGEKIESVKLGDLIAYKNGRGTVVIANDISYRLLTEGDLLTKLVEK